MQRTFAVFRARLKLVLLSFACAIHCASGTPQTSPTARVTIKVADQTGAGISGAHVRVVPPPDAPPATMETDNKGELPLNLKVGGHGIFVSAQGFKSSIEHIEVRPASEAQVIPVELRVSDTGSPVVISEEEAAEEARELFLSAMPYHADWWIKSVEFNAMPHKVGHGHQSRDRKEGELLRRAALGPAHSGGGALGSRVLRPRSQDVCFSGRCCLFIGRAGTGPAKRRSPDRRFERCASVNPARRTLHARRFSRYSPRTMGEASAYDHDAPVVPIAYLEHFSIRCTL
jgi:hypothetical protein